MRKQLILPVVLILMLALSSCQLFSNLPVTYSPQAQTLAAGTLTAEAFTPSAAPTDTLAPAGDTAVPPTPTEYVPGEGVPPQAAALQIPQGATTILLMGSDQRPGAPDFRTDTMVLLVLKKDGSAELISFPRDLWVYLPGVSMQRLNAAMEFGGFDLVKSTFKYNFGFAPESYVLTNFGGFKSIVNSLGGVDVQVGAELQDARTGFPDGFKVEPGMVHMDGDLALWYVRSRKTTSDLDRLRRSQEVLFAIGRKLLSLNGLTRVPEFYSAFRGAVATDLTVGDATSLLPLLKSINQDNMQRYAISIDQVIPYRTSQGADVLLMKPDAIRQMLSGAFAQ